MNRFIFYLTRIAAVIAMWFILSGCTRTIKSADIIPQVHTGSPLKSVSPKIFIFKEFKDARGITDPLLFLVIDNFKLEEPPAIIVAKATKSELERNGHTCIDNSQQSKANFIVEGTVYKYWVRQESGFFGGDSTGNIALKLTVSSVLDDKRIFTKSYGGEYASSSASFQEILSQALLFMVKEMSTDPEFVEFLEK